ncbi:hypothetical protein [Leptospira idonii]|uniref:Uncharacterized protein n=1 Tax=Leptospira idonii TaxID=1193500 RepID=A0A4R9LZQ7_9LEPT|nr:hypothetical protein [Leptospira idonii]TGN18857.1 hypothetical protein EHS15_11830 [Leptospira idonii]
MSKTLMLASLKADLTALENLIAEATKANDFIGLMQYKFRKSEIEDSIIALNRNLQLKANIALFFGGKPVFGTLGISANFAGKILNEFQSLVSNTYAFYNLKANNMNLPSNKGKIPLANDSNLMVTSVVHGSFGFVLEELNDETRIFASPLISVVENVVKIIQKTSSEKEEEFNEIITSLNMRIINSLKIFFHDLDSNFSTIRLVERDTDISLDEKAIHRGRTRTEHLEIDNIDIEIQGLLIGFLPDHLKFEIQLESGEIIYGSVDKYALEQLKQKEKPIIGNFCKILVNMKTIEQLNGDIKRDYLLKSFLDQKSTTHNSD